MTDQQKSLDSLLRHQEDRLIASTKRGFYKISFEITRNGIPIHMHTFTVNPEEMSREDEAFVTVTKTLGGVFVDSFGLGTITYNLKGTTGYHPKRNAEGVIVDGLDEIKSLRDQIYRFFMEPDGTPKERTVDDYQLIYHDWLMGEHFLVQPTSKFLLARNKQRPLLYAYDFSFVVLQPTTFGSDYKGRGENQDPLWKEIENTRKRLQAAFDTLLKGNNFLRVLTALIFGGGGGGK